MPFNSSGKDELSEKLLVLTSIVKMDHIGSPHCIMLIADHGKNRMNMVNQSCEKRQNGRSLANEMLAFSSFRK